MAWRAARAIDLGGGAVDRIGLALPVRRTAVFRRWGLEICDSRASSREMASFNCRATPGSPPRGASLRGAGREICSTWRAMESSRLWISATSCASRLRHRRRAVRRCCGNSPARIADGRIQPVAQRHAGAARGSLGPLADRWLDALYTPRYARIHALVRSRLRRLTQRLQLPARPIEETTNSRAGRLPPAPTFSCYGKYRVKNAAGPAEKLPCRSSGRRSAGDLTVGAESETARAVMMSQVICPTRSEPARVVSGTEALPRRKKVLYGRSVQPAERTPCRSTRPRGRRRISCSTTCFRSTATTIFPASPTPPPTCARRSSIRGRQAQRTGAAAAQPRRRSRRLHAPRRRPRHHAERLQGSIQAVRRRRLARPVGAGRIRRAGAAGHAVARPSTNSWCSANMAFAMYPGLTQGAIAALIVHGTAEQKATYRAEDGGRRNGPAP